MTETWPSEAYVGLSERYAKELREEWEKRGGPQEGDWYKSLVIEFACPHCLGFKEAHEMQQRFYFDDTAKQKYIWLPQPRQLVEMLEERGCVWRHGKIDPLHQSLWAMDGFIEKDDWYWASIRPEIGDKKRIVCYAPDPASALLLAWVEATGKEEGG